MQIACWRAGCSSKLEKVICWHRCAWDQLQKRSTLKENDFEKEINFVEDQIHSFCCQSGDNGIPEHPLFSSILVMAHDVLCVPLAKHPSKGFCWIIIRRVHDSRHVRWQDILHQAHPVSSCKELHVCMLCPLGWLLGCNDAHCRIVVLTNRRWFSLFKSRLAQN